MSECRFCSRQIATRKDESHTGDLCGSCWEVSYRLDELLQKPAFRRAVIHKLERYEVTEE